LAALKQLTFLLLSSANVTDRALKASLETGLLHSFNLAWGDSGRPAKLEDVTSLNLSGAKITDAGI
jgi:hypothetical protein